jgi:hypothetical protein
LLLKAAERLRDVDPELARETYLEALAAAIFAGPLAGPGARSPEVAHAARAAPPAQKPGGLDLLLDGLVAFLIEMYAAAVPILRETQRAFEKGMPQAEQLRWMWRGTVAAKQEPRMARDLAGGPARMVLTASVARRYYLEGKSKIEIAEEFALSRFKVARLLDVARASGPVKIEISYRGEVDLELSGQLQERFGLTHSVVVDTPDDDIHSLRQHLGTAAAALLTEIVTVDDVLGMGWSRSVSAVAAALTELAPRRSSS